MKIHVSIRLVVHRAVNLSFTLLALVACSSTFGQIPITIGFDKLPDGSPTVANTEITTQFESLGVVFDSVRLPGSPRATTIVNWVPSIYSPSLSPNGEGSIGGTLMLTFTTPVSSVGSLIIDDNLPVTITAFDANSIAVGTATSDGRNDLAADSWEIAYPSGIKRVELAGGSIGFGIPDGWGIDNLTFTPLFNSFPSVDSFDPQASGSVYALALHRDATIYVGGRFGGIGGQVRGFGARLNPDGSLDQSFADVFPGLFTTVFSLSTLPDRKALLGGGLRVLSDGILDTSFQPGVNGVPYAVAVQADGRIVLGGVFTSVGGEPRERIARIYPDGTIDRTFNVGANNVVYSLAIQADGKILVGGQFSAIGGQPRNCIARLSADGTLDGAFAPQADLLVNAFVEQPDGKILIGGHFTTINGQPRKHLARLNGDGSLDPTFTPDAGSAVSSLALQTDGKIIVGGFFTSINSQQRYFLARLNADGNLDEGFYPGADGVVDSLAIQADGKILVGGEFGKLGGETRYSIGRLNNTGPATQTLAYDGTSITWFRGGTSPEVWRTTFDYSTNGWDWAFLGAGERTSGGWSLTNVSMPFGATLRAQGFVTGGRYNASSGIVETHSGKPVFFLQPTGRTNITGTTAMFTVAGGSPEPLNYQWLKNGNPLLDVARMTGADRPALTIDPVLKSDEGAYSAVLTDSFGSVTSTVAILTVIDPFIINQPMGTNRNPGESVVLNVVAGGTPPFDYQWFHDGIAVPGAVDSSFTLQNVSESDAGPYTVVVSNTNGSYTSEVAVLTVNAVFVDSSFNHLLSSGASSLVNSLAVQACGKILVGGSFTTLGGEIRNGLARLNVDGSLDTAFDPKGSGGVYTLALQDDGMILVGGTFTSVGGKLRRGIARLHSDGTLDNAFNPGSNGAVRCIAVQTNGSILVGGVFSNVGGQPRANIAQIDSSGNIEEAFNPGVSGNFPVVFCLALQTDGKILVGGRFTTLSGQPRSNIGRLNADGTLDTSFNPGASDTVFSMALQADGKILVGGRFTALAGRPRNRLARLNADGTLDSAFDPGANNDVLSLALETDGRILVGGAFTSLGGQSRDCIARLNSAGTLDGTFNPGVSHIVQCLALQADGKILVGGRFTTLGGQQRNYLGRFENTAPAIQTVYYDGTTITWLRGGTSPEAWRTRFDYSLNGSMWNSIGAGERIAEGWQLTNVSLPLAGKLRARGYIAGGFEASGWFTETIIDLAPTIQMRAIRNGETVVVSWTGNYRQYQLQRSSDLRNPQSWQDFGVLMETNSISLPVEAGELFLRILGR